MDPGQDGGEYTCLVRGSASSTAKKALYVDIIRKYPRVISFVKSKMLTLLN